MKDHGGPPSSPTIQVQTPRSQGRRTDLLKVTQPLTVLPGHLSFSPPHCLSASSTKPTLSSCENRQWPKTQGRQITMRPHMCRTHLTFTATSPPLCFCSHCLLGLMCPSPISPTQLQFPHSSIQDLKQILPPFQILTCFLPTWYIISSS